MWKRLDSSTLCTSKLQYSWLASVAKINWIAVWPLGDTFKEAYRKKEEKKLTFTQNIKCEGSNSLKLCNWGLLKILPAHTKDLSQSIVWDTWRVPRLWYKTHPVHFIVIVEILANVNQKKGKKGHYQRGFLEASFTQKKWQKWALKWHHLDGDFLFLNCISITVRLYCVQSGW